MTMMATVARLNLPMVDSMQASESIGSTKSKILIGICTRQRNALLHRLLRSLLAQPAPLDYEIEIVVIDNNDHPTAQAALIDLPVGYPIGIIHEPRAGLVYARNTALEAATTRQAEWFVGVDDDEWVAPDWLAQLIRGFRAAGPVVLIGLSRYVYHDDLSPFRRPRQLPTMTPGKQPGVLGCGNYALHRKLFDPSCGVGLRFDLSYNESGGEDFDFMLRAKRVHDWGLYGWPAAIAFEDCLGERATLRYRLKRAIRSQILMHQVGRAHRQAGYHGGLVKNTVRILLRVNRNFIYGMAGLMGGLTMFVINAQTAKQMIGDGLERCACLWAVIPFIFDKRPKAYGSAVEQVAVDTE